MFAVLAALGSALLVAVANVLQHRAGGGSGDRRLAQVMRHPLWLFGALAGVAGFALHVAALAGGALAFVQPLLVCGLLFALPLSRALDHQVIGRGELAAAASVVCGLALFQLTASPSAGRADPNLGTLAWCVAAVAGATAIGIAFAIKRPRGRAAWLGLCAGIGFGLAAALIKATVGGFASHGLAALASWPPYAFLAVVAVAIALNQLAFNAGPLAVSLPILTIVDPLVSVAIGAIAFNETVSSGVWSVTGQVVGFAMMSIGVRRLCRSSDSSEARDTARSRGHAEQPSNVETSTLPRRTAAVPRG